MANKLPSGHDSLTDFSLHSFNVTTSSVNYSPEAEVRPGRLPALTPENDDTINQRQFFQYVSNINTSTPKHDQNLVV